jgi:WD40 repeat protein
MILSFVSLAGVAAEEIVLFPQLAHAWSVYAVAFSPDGALIASGSEDKTVRIWNAETGREQRTLQGHTGRINSVAFSPDGRRIASGGDDGAVFLWDALTGEVVVQMVFFSNDQWVCLGRQRLLYRIAPWGRAP